jgi:FkbM family methyltransferase
MNYEDLQKWFSIGGDDSLRVNYPLDENSIVLDLGGYEGTWAQKIFDKYQCNILVFEPIPNLYENLVEKFKLNNKIKVYNFGISDIDKEIEISLLNDGSSFYIDSENKVTTKVVSMIKFLKENNLNNIDLIKINIEGDEFPVLKSLIDNDMINIFNDIQVQFHQFIPDSINQRNWIREKLSLTHKLTYDYEFVWENWEKI